MNIYYNSKSLREAVAQLEILAKGSERRVQVYTMCVCMYVCMYVCMCVYIYIYIYIYTLLCTYMYTYIYIYMYIYIYIYRERDIVHISHRCPCTRGCRSARSWLGRLLKEDIYIYIYIYIKRDMILWYSTM